MFCLASHFGPTFWGDFDQAAWQDPMVAAALGHAQRRAEVAAQRHLAEQLTSRFAALNRITGGGADASSSAVAAEAGASSSSSAAAADPAAPAAAQGDHRDRMAAYMSGVHARRDETQRRRQQRARELTAALDAIMASGLGVLGTGGASASAPPPADPAFVESHSLLSVWGAEGPAETQCVICCDDLAEGDEVRTLPCGHVYHKECVDEWLQRSRLCCLCKRPIDGEQ
mmetsp:Transcript_167204/g.537087  ORF Transcript_167204/g.537087 Transcript_167204/m.537087 type:complete len:228 (-) Transcript_167204:92-775(-)